MTAQRGMPEKRARRVRKKATVSASIAIKEQPPSEFTTAADFFPPRKTLKTLAQVLRAPTPEARRQANADLIADLKIVARHI